MTSDMTNFAILLVGITDGITRTEVALREADAALGVARKEQDKLTSLLAENALLIDFLRNMTGATPSTAEPVRDYSQPQVDPQYRRESFDTRAETRDRPNRDEPRRSRDTLDPPLRGMDMDKVRQGVAMASTGLDAAKGFIEMLEGFNRNRRR